MRHLLMFTIALAGAPALAGNNSAAKHLAVTSSAFPAGGAIPDDYTCAGTDTSPQLTWSNPPDSAKSVAILVDDPDAPKGTVLHWLITGLDPQLTGLPKGANLPDGAAVTKNEKGDAKYMGPCPPVGAPHHYHFKVYALDAQIGKPATREEFQTSIRGHVVGMGELIGTYQKK
ncbi:MAG: YbhB/YbcL family Raf kinase inhibitor-like protein [Kofleriaceae bacterium]